MMVSAANLVPAIAFSFSTIAGPATMAAEQPNIIFILVDDMGWSDIGCYGSEIRTPNIDSLAENGIRFTQFYNTAKCNPTRASLLTGMYHQKTDMTGPNVMKNSATLGEVLRPVGYRTLASGKHHGTENLHDRGFDHYYGLRDGCSNFWNPGVQREGEPAPARKRYRYWCDDETTYHPYTPEDRDFYTTDAFTDRALRWLDEPDLHEKPFFLYLAYTAPHFPLQAWPADIAKYEGVDDDGYLPIREARYERMIEMGLIDPQKNPLPEWDGKDWDAHEDLERRKEGSEIHSICSTRAHRYSAMHFIGSPPSTASASGCRLETGFRSINQGWPPASSRYSTLPSSIFAWLMISATACAIGAFSSVPHFRTTSGVAWARQ
ncbi:MAG TPA: sulfatase-like hydrolase/transferase [Oceanipulchritudo sp.]|nr:sulfatase-like hydrolase/transferase [Oceanipulchritudo sp.]